MLPGVVCLSAGRVYRYGVLMEMSRMAVGREGTQNSRTGHRWPCCFQWATATATGCCPMKTACETLKPFARSVFLEHKILSSCGVRCRHDEAEHPQLLLARPRSCVGWHGPCSHRTRLCDHRGRRQQGLELVSHSLVSRHDQRWHGAVVVRHMSVDADDDGGCAHPW